MRTDTQPATAPELQPARTRERVLVAPVYHLAELDGERSLQPGAHVRTPDASGAGSRPPAPS